MTKLGGNGSDLLTPFYTNSLEIGKPKFHKMITVLISAIVRARFIVLFSQLAVPRPRHQDPSLIILECKRSGFQLCLVRRRDWCGIGFPV